MSQTSPPLNRAIANLERASVEDRRPIYSNLIKFAELYPTKIRLGVYAPAASAAATSPNFSAVSGSMRAGSCKVSTGARRPTLLEHRVTHKMHLIQWKRPQMDLSELARLRWIENWPCKRLAQHYGKSENALQCQLQRAKMKHQTRQGRKH